MAFVMIHVVQSSPCNATSGRRLLVGVMGQLHYQATYMKWYQRRLRLVPRLTCMKHRKELGDTCKIPFPVHESRSSIINYHAVIKFFNV